MIALLGDSLSVGSFPYLKARVPEAVNFSTVGAFLLAEPGYPGRPSLESRVAEIAARAPRHVLVMGGTNDLAGYPTATAVLRARKLARLLDAHGLASTFATVPVQKTANDPKVTEYNYQLLAGMLSPTPVVDVGGAAKASQLAGDGVHFTPAGYKAIGEAWADVVAKLGLPPAPADVDVDVTLDPTVLPAVDTSSSMSGGAKVAAFAGLGLLAYWLLRKR